MNSCFEDLDGRVGLKRVWEFVPKAGKKRNEKVKVSRMTHYLSKLGHCALAPWINILCID